MAFLYRFLKEKIYIIQSTIFEDDTTRVYFLKKSLYNLKQSLQMQYQTFLDFFRKLEFYKTKTDYSLFILGNKTMFITIYMDNLLLFGTDIYLHIDNIMQNSQNKFLITDLGDVSHYLEIKIDVDLSKNTITF